MIQFRNDPGQRLSDTHRARTSREAWLAEDLLSRLVCLVHALDDGGQVSMLHMVALHDKVLRLLDEIGGFDEVLTPYRQPDAE